MNQLEHLKALRDKARVQTEQAKAVLKQQGEISESLDRLIAALEGGEFTDDETRNDSISAATGAARAVVAPDSAKWNGQASRPEKTDGSLGQMIAKLDKNSAGEMIAAGVAGTAAVGLVTNLPENDGGEAEADVDSKHEDVIWVEEAKPLIPATGKPTIARVPPKLEPIVWEVAQEIVEDESTLEASPVEPAESIEEKISVSSEIIEESGSANDTEIGLPGAVGVAGGIAAAGALLDQAQNAGVKENAKFRFLKFGKKEEAAATEIVDEKVESGESALDEIVEEISHTPVNPPLSVTGAVPSPGGSILSDAAEKAEKPEAGDSVDDTEKELVVRVNASVDTVAIDPSIVVPPIPVPVPVTINETTFEEVAETDSEVITDEVVVGTEEIEIVEASVPDVVEEVSAPEVEAVPENDDTVPIPPIPAIPTLPTIAAAGVAVGAVAAALNDDQTEEEEVVPIIPVPAVPRPVAVSSNVFFDANSAYLKESELTKIQTISEAVSGAESRIVKIQGLEDLASSNDFKILLASRRMLAVKKKLAEKGIGADQIKINEIKLSEEGRVLEPPSIEIAPVAS